MNRQEFMNQLEMLLSDISQAERDEALQYYNDYLDDAGIENEESAIRALGSPIQVAANIKEGLKEGNEAGEFMENGFHMNNEEKDMMILPGEASSEDDKAAEETRFADGNTDGVFDAILSSGGANADIETVDAEIMKAEVVDAAVVNTDAMDLDVVTAHSDSADSNGAGSNGLVSNSANTDITKKKIQLRQTAQSRRRHRKALWISIPIRSAAFTRISIPARFTAKSRIWILRRQARGTRAAARARQVAAGIIRTVMEISTAASTKTPGRSLKAIRIRQAART